MSETTMVQVHSSNIAAIGYDPKAQLLQVQFKGRADGSHGPKWNYYDVPSKVHEQLMQSESKGSFFSSHIKTAYKSEKTPHRESHA